ncbi:MAG: D-aminoacyl-tRNA deacylase [Deltaproteobacteria bacterium]|nr:D-aminoacyl-tRNA deacylase [Deltaproteobacteria bacterium]
MRAVVQRVKESKVVVEGKTIGEIGKGLVVLLGVERGDTEADARGPVTVTLDSKQVF